MQGPISNPPLDPITYLLDPFDTDNETKTRDIHFSTYPKSSLINDNQKTSELTIRENEEGQKCNNATGSYNQVYVDPLLSRQHQNKESDSLEQRVDALIKKQELIQNRRSLVNDHYVPNTLKHEHSVQIDHNGYEMTLMPIGKNIEDAINHPPIKIMNWKNTPLSQ